MGTETSESRESRESEPVPKLPRGRGIRLAGPELFRIGLTILTLVGVLLLTRPCATAVSGFVTSFDNAGSGGSAMPKPGNVDVPQPHPQQQFETLRPGMSEAEIKAAIERSKARQAGSGSDVQSGAGSGSTP
ncbi:MAG TPA: hypothetical protein VK926_07275 [Gaiellaceae bacterium]|nr:hypothetical protein [Gaiellaceae bacterium]